MNNVDMTHEELRILNSVGCSGKLPLTYHDGALVLLRQGGYITRDWFSRFGGWRVTERGIEYYERGIRGGNLRQQDRDLDRDTPPVVGCWEDVPREYVRGG